MTTIAYRDGVMASDSSGWMNDSTTLVPGWRRKVHRLADGTLYGGSGETGPVLKIRRWIEEGGMEEGTLPPGKPSAVYGFFVRPDGRLFVVQDGEVEEILDAPFYSCGSGSDAALGAMHMGATAEQAVEIAMRVDGGTAGRVVSERLGRWDGPRLQPAEAEWRHHGEPWTDGLDRRLVETARSVLSAARPRLDLCRILGRSPASVDSRLRRLGYADLADRLAQCPG